MYKTIITYFDVLSVVYNNIIFMLPVLHVNCIISSLYIKAKDMQMTSCTSAKRLPVCFLLAGELKDGNMFWTDIMYGSTSSIGSGYSYKSGEAFLTVLKDGPYFLYTQLNLTCIGVCSNGSVSITFYDEKSELLSCELDLSTPPYIPMVKKCYTVIPRLTNGTRITAKMQNKLESVDGWKLDLNHSGFGMFLVDGP